MRGDCVASPSGPAGDSDGRRGGCETHGGASARLGCNAGLASLTRVSVFPRHWKQAVERAGQRALHRCSRAWVGRARPGTLLERRSCDRSARGARPPLQRRTMTARRGEPHAGRGTETGQSSRSRRRRPAPDRDVLRASTWSSRPWRPRRADRRVTVFEGGAAHRPGVCRCPIRHKELGRDGGRERRSLKEIGKRERLKRKATAADPAEEARDHAPSCAPAEPSVPLASEPASRRDRQEGRGQCGGMKRSGGVDQRKSLARPWDVLRRQVPCPDASHVF